MKNKRKKNEVSDDMFMLLAEDARNANVLTGTGIASNQILMQKFYHRNQEDRISEKTEK